MGLVRFLKRGQIAHEEKQESPVPALEPGIDAKPLEARIEEAISDFNFSKDCQLGFEENVEQVLIPSLRILFLDVALGLQKGVYDDESSMTHSYDNRNCEEKHEAFDSASAIAITSNDETRIDEALSQLKKLVEGNQMKRSNAGSWRSRKSVHGRNNMDTEKSLKPLLTQVVFEFANDYRGRTLQRVERPGSTRTDIETIGEKDGHPMHGSKSQTKDEDEYEPERELESGVSSLDASSGLDIDTKLRVQGVMAASMQEDTKFAEMMGLDTEEITTAMASLLDTPELLDKFKQVLIIDFLVEYSKVAILKITQRKKIFTVLKSRLQRFFVAYLSMLLPSCALSQGGKFDASLQFENYDKCKKGDEKLVVVQEEFVDGFTLAEIATQNVCVRYYDGLFMRRSHKQNVESILEPLLQTTMDKLESLCRVFEHYDGDHSDNDNDESNNSYESFTADQEYVSYFNDLLRRLTGDKVIITIRPFLAEAIQRLVVICREVIKNGNGGDSALKLNEDEEEMIRDLESDEEKDSEEELLESEESVIFEPIDLTDAPPTFRPRYSLSDFDGGN